MRLIYICFTAILILPFFSAEAATKVNQNEVKALAALENGRQAFFDYRFDDAADFYNEYKTLITKAKKPVAEELEEYERVLNIAINAFDRVEKITIIDSLSFPRESFYNNYNLTSFSGKLLDSKNLRSKPQDINTELGIFVNEDNDLLLWTQQDEEGEYQLKESRRLLDGSWITQNLFQDDFDTDGDYIFPFMMPDGQTLYFANNGDESLGGYDLFVAQRDPITGEYRQPLNMGMPFNSPYDDLMLAIDEINGIGWWATDRNSPEGEVTVYVYLLNDMRENYPSSQENLADMAKITEYKATQDPAQQQKYESIRKKIKK